MGYREYGMWEILEVLRRHHRGEKKRRIALATGHTRVTVRRYIATAQKLGWSSEREPDEELAREVVARLQPGPRASPAGSLTNEQRLLVHIDQIRSWLQPADGKRGLRLTRIRTLLKQQCGVDVSYGGLRRFAQAYCQFGARTLTVRMAETAPGEIAEVDFGLLGRVPDPNTGKQRLLYALIVTLIFSRHQYVYVTHTQNLGDVVNGLENAWEFFGGVPQRVIVDNMKTAITRADRYEPAFQRVFAEYSAYRGFVIDAAVAAHPTGKPHVERAVPYVRESFFRGGQWRDAAHVQREAERWCLQEAGQRIHGTTRQMPAIVFEGQERCHLGPIIGERFDPPQWSVCKVHPDHHVCFGLSFYSVPTRYVGHKVDVRGDQQLVRIYVKGELIKTHPRVPKGKKSTDYSDYPPERAAYAMRDVNYWLGQAAQIGAHAAEFTSRLLAACPTRISR
ncbi:MAG: IS21 family transposase [Deltaproteobacteria bacterium]|nr:IS21 family transposase [Deltaproteobacteria bacterium]